MSDAHLKNSKSKLQQDDPSIILCTVKEQSKQMLSNEKQVASSNYNLKQKTSSPSSRPKTGPARYYGRKSQPVNINQKQSGQKGGSQYNSDSFYGHHPSHTYEPRSKSTTSQTNNLKSARTFSSRSGNTKNHSKSDLKFGTSFQQFSKTGTPIDNLITAPSPKPKSSNPAFHSSQVSAKDTKTKHCEASKFAEKKVLESSYKKSEKNPGNKSIINKSITTKPKNISLSKGKESPTNTTDKDAEKRRKKKVTKKSKKSENDLQPKPIDSKNVNEINKIAGREILNLVNGGLKTSIKSEIPLQPSVITAPIVKPVPESNKSNDNKPIVKEVPVVVKNSNSVSDVLNNNVGKLQIPLKQLNIDHTSEDGNNKKIPTPPESSLSESTGSCVKTSIKDDSIAPIQPTSSALKTDQVKQASGIKVAKKVKEISEDEEKLAFKQAAQRLKKEGLVLLKQKSIQFPNAKFFCEVCSYHLDGIPHSHRHVKEKRHKKNLKDHQQDEFLRRLKTPPDDAVVEIQQLLMKKVVNKNILTKEDLDLRKSLVERLNLFMSDSLPNCKLVLYGSSLSGLGFKSSDVNLDLQHPDEVKPPNVLLEILSLLNKSEQYLNVDPDFHAKFPHIDFMDAETKLFVQISTGNEFAVSTSRLLTFYTLLDQRVVQLAMIFRTWAHICKLDLQHDGALPPHAIPIMTIFFLQVHKHLPVLHEIITEWDMEKILSSSFDCPQLEFRDNKLWYLPSNPPENHTSSQAVSDQSDSDSDEDVSFVLQETTLDFSHLSTVGCENSVIISSDEKSDSEESVTTSAASVVPTSLCDRCPPQTVTLASLFLDMLKFYGVDYEMENEIINIRSSLRLKRSDKNWSKKRIAVMDPYLLKRNLCRSLNSQAVFSYFMNRLKGLLLYFFDPKLLKEANENHTINTGKRTLSERSSSSASSEVRNSGIQANSATTKYAENLADVVLSNVLSNTSIRDSSTSFSLYKVMQLAENVINDIISDIEKNNVSSKEMDQDYQVSADNLAMDITNEALKEISKSLDPQLSNSSKTDSDLKSDSGRKYNYDFTVKIITAGKYPVKVCGLCKKEGHSRSNCPDEMIKQQLPPLPPLTPSHAATLDRISERMFGYYVPTPVEIRHRDLICNSLSSYLQHTYNSSTRMSLFGSSRNGFGFKGSDLDICMTFHGNPDGENLNPVLVIEEVARQLRKNPEFWNILPITTAKVPIVKFVHRESGLEGDISLYNLLAQRNTSMLRFYSLIDRRCKVLGYVVKAFVKLCNIGDASRGSLSSYAYTLMVIFYLQQKTVPVLPVLQELYNKKKKKPSLMVDGWNSWYYDNIDNLHSVWDGYKKNKESIGELWLGLLRFYTEEFDFKRCVVCTRQKKTLTTFEKEWTSKFISIEDPFDLNHNLAAGVSHKMTKFIIGVFVKAREHFASKPNGMKPFDDYRLELKYYFDPNILMDGQEAPNDRCCRICGKIGHFVRDCPKNKRNKRVDPKSSSKLPAEVVCFYCNKEGHRKRDCPALKKDNEQKFKIADHDSPRHSNTSGRERKSSSGADSKHKTPTHPASQSPRKILIPHRRLGSSNQSPSEDVKNAGRTSPLSRSLSEDFNNARSPSNRSRRLFQRNVVSLDSTQPDVIPLVSNDRNPSAPHDIRSLPHTSPAPFMPFPSSSSNFLMSNSNFSRSPLSSSPRKNQLSSSAPTNYQPQIPFRSMPAPFPISPWPNSSVWGISPHMLPSPSAFPPPSSIEFSRINNPTTNTCSPRKEFSPSHRSHDPNIFSDGASPKMRPLFLLPPPGMYPVYNQPKPPASLSDAEVMSSSHQISDEK